jgi:hypothetical protein
VIEVGPCIVETAQQRERPIDVGMTGGNIDDQRAPTCGAQVREVAA